MNGAVFARTLVCTAVLGLATGNATWSAEPPAKAAANKGPATYPIDLPGALALAGARNLDVEIARERLAEAKAAKKIALEAIFPSISGGAAYRRHDGATQNVQGDIENVHKESYAPGVAVTLQADLGDAIFRSLEARQLVNAAGHGLEAQTQGAIVAAAGAYLDLVKAQAQIRTTGEALRVSEDYGNELETAVKIGIAFEGDALQARGKENEDRIAMRRAEEDARVAAMHLAAIVNLEPGVTLIAEDASPVPLRLVDADVAVADQVAAALAARPELQQRGAEVDAAREAELGAKYGPLAPSITGQVFTGGIGGGQDSGPHRFDHSEDYLVGLSWRLGPGGLFDIGRIEGSQARTHRAELEVDKTRRAIAEQVLAGREHVDSLAVQVDLAEKSSSDARDVLRLRRQRKDFGIAAVLEVIQAERDWSRCVDDYLAKVTNYNKAQYELLRATGALGDGIHAPAVVR